MSLPAPAGTEEGKQRNVQHWLESIEAVLSPACPVWNRGYRLACDLGPPLAIYGPSLDNGSLAATGEELKSFYSPLFSQGGEGDAHHPLVYVPTLSLPSFVADVLPLIPPHRRFVLVTGLGDWGPAQVFGKGNAAVGTPPCEALFGDARLLGWFAEMLDFGLGATPPSPPSPSIIPKDEKPLVALPLGVDLHTLAFKPEDRPVWGRPDTPLSQAASLYQARHAAAHEDPRAYVFWGIRNRRRMAVSAVAEQCPAIYSLDPSPVGSLPRVVVWQRMGACQWVVCVQGYGYDCHRTWEALWLGCGVVVEDMALTRRFLGGFPALFVPCNNNSNPLDARGGAGGVREKGDFSKAWRRTVSLDTLREGLRATTLEGKQGEKGVVGLERLCQQCRVGVADGLVEGDTSLLLGKAARDLLGEVGGIASRKGVSTPSLEGGVLPPLLLLSTWVRAMKCLTRA